MIVSHRGVAARFALVLASVLAGAAPASAQSPAAGVTEIPIAYLSEAVAKLPPLSLVDPDTTDQGLLGARLGIEDNNTTGRFTGQHFTLTETVLAAGGDVAAAFRALVAAGHHLNVADLPAAALLAIADQIGSAHV